LLIAEQIENSPKLESHNRIASRFYYIPTNMKFLSWGTQTTHTLKE